MEKQEHYLYEDLTYEVIGCAYSAFKAVGAGFDEIRYHKIFNEYLLQKGINANYKVPIMLDYKGEIIAEFEIDEVVENKLVVELKCIQSNFIPENYAQILTYLKLSKLKIGLLINFGLHKAFPKRIIYEDQRIPDIEKWDKKFFQNAKLRKYIDVTVSCLKNINKVLEVAHRYRTYQAALRCELKQNQLKWDENVAIDKKIEGIQFTPYEIDYWLIEKSFLLGVLAGNNEPRFYDFVRMRNYMRLLKLTHGLIAFWSSKNFQLYGIYEE